jgi:ribose 5-phosphate isomerase B
MRIAIGSDHAGFSLKGSLITWMREQGHEVADLGTDSAERTDYPEFGAAVGHAVVAGDADVGVAICGSGQGICMAANKVPGVRSALVRNDWDAQMSRSHNDANVVCFGAQVTDAETAIQALEIFFTTPFEGGRHAPRVDKLDEMR